LGTFGAVLRRFARKTEQKARKATVSLTAAQDVVLAADDEDALAGVTAGVRMF
jgi:hypothetical protein